jgi:hypothetical protein
MSKKTKPEKNPIPINEPINERYGIDITFSKGIWSTPDGSRFNTLLKAERHLKRIFQLTVDN